MVFNIKENKPKLYDYTIRDYFPPANYKEINKKKYIKYKKEFTPYLWTSAFGLLRLLKEYKRDNINRDAIELYIKITHDILGTHTENNNKLSELIFDKLEWIKEKKDLIDLTKPDDSLIGSLRIGKFEQKEGENPGIYLHYTTKWIFSLLKTSEILNSNIFLYQATNMLLTMCEKNVIKSSEIPLYPRKMNQTLDEPEQPGEISHDPLDVFIIIFNTIYCFIKYEKNTELKEFYLDKLLFFLNKNIIRIQEYTEGTLTTYDQLGIGFLLTSCLKIRLIINKINNKLFEPIIKKINNFNKKSFIKFLNDFYLLLLNTTKHSFLNGGLINKNNENSDAYRWLGISIGLRGIKVLKFKTEKFITNNNKNYIKNILETDKKALIIINNIMEKYNIRKDIHNNFNKKSYNKNNWNQHLDINIVTFLYSLNPFFNF